MININMEKLKKTFKNIIKKFTNVRNYVITVYIVSWVAE